jgi:hypothetical protein
VGAGANRVDQAEDGGVAADADRQREHGDDGEAGRLAQRPQREPDVLPHAFKRRKYPHIARLLLQIRNVAKAAARFVARRVGRQSAGAELRFAHGEMKRHLVVQIALQAAPQQQRTEPVEIRDQFLHCCLGVCGGTRGLGD